MNSESNNEFYTFLQQCRNAVGQQVGGNTAPFHQLWAHTDDVVLMGAAGAHQIGWTEVDSHLTWAAEHLAYTRWDVINLMTQLDGDLAVTVDLEKMSAPAAQPPLERTLRVTQVYRRTADGWKLIVRHGDPWIRLSVSREPTARSTLVLGTEGCGRQALALRRNCGARQIRRIGKHPSVSIASVLVQSRAPSFRVAILVAADCQALCLRFS